MKKINIFDKKVSVVSLSVMCAGTVPVALLTLFLSACFHSAEGGVAQINEFIERCSYFSRNFFGVFDGAYADSIFLILFFLLETFYGLGMIALLLRPNKYIRGKEYGSAAWGDCIMVNRQLASFKPNEKYRVYYQKEKPVKKIFRKLCERKKDYIR